MRARLSLIVGVTLAVAGCGEDGRTDLGPPPPGIIDAPPIDGLPTDAPIDAPIDAAVDAQVIDAPPLQFDGIICPIADLRDALACPPTPERMGVVVKLAGTLTMATSGQFGRYVLPTESPAVTLYIGDGAQNVEPTDGSFTVGGLVNTPVVVSSYWDGLRTALGITPLDTNGTIVVYVTQNGSPLAGVTFDPIGGSFVETFYDGLNPLGWQTTATGESGAAILFDVPPGPHTVSGSTEAGQAIDITGVNVRSAAITIVHYAVPPPP